MSTVGISLAASARMQASAVARLMSSTRSGPASTWQWAQVWLHTRPTLIWSTSIPVAPSGKSPARSRWRSKSAPSGSSTGTWSSVARCTPASARGAWRRARVGRILGRAPVPVTASLAKLHPQLVRHVAHLHPVDERGPALDGRGHVRDLGELRRIAALLQGVAGVGVDAVRALDGEGRAERDQALLARGERALGEDGPVPVEELLPERGRVLGDVGELGEIQGVVVGLHGPKDRAGAANAQAAPAAGQPVAQNPGQTGATAERPRRSPASCEPYESWGCAWSARRRSWSRSRRASSRTSAPGSRSRSAGSPIP